MPKKTWSLEEIQSAVDSAKIGNEATLQNFFIYLYEELKLSLISLTTSEDSAKEYFSRVILKFRKRFVEQAKPLPHKNLRGFVYTMAKFMFIDDQKEKVYTESTDNLPDNRAAASKTAEEYEAQDQLELLQHRAMLKGIEQLTVDCKQLFEVMLETSEEKPSKLYKLLGWKNARQVTTRKHDCTKQLKVKAAIALEKLFNQKNAEI